MNADWFRPFNYLLSCFLGVRQGACCVTEGAGRVSAVGQLGGASVGQCDTEALAVDQVADNVLQELQEVKVVEKLLCGTHSFTFQVGNDVLVTKSFVEQS